MVARMTAFFCQVSLSGFTNMLAMFIGKLSPLVRITLLATGFFAYWSIFHMKRFVITPVYKLKIFYSVVKFVEINVVYFLVWQKWSSQILLHNIAVFIYHNIIYTNTSVSTLLDKTIGWMCLIVARSTSLGLFINELLATIYATVKFAFMITTKASFAFIANQFLPTVSTINCFSRSGLLITRQTPFTSPVAIISAINAISSHFILQTKSRYLAFCQSCLRKAVYRRIATLCRQIKNYLFSDKVIISQFNVIGGYLCGIQPGN